MSFTNEETKKCHLHDCFGIKYDNLNQEGKKLTETARQQIQSAVLSVSTRRPEAREIIGLRKEAEVDRAPRRMLSSANQRLKGSKRVSKLKEVFFGWGGSAE